MTSLARISLPQYELMIEHGVFDGKYHQRVELIRGEIRQMNPIGHEHAVVVDFLAEWSIRSDPKGERHVRIQNPLFLPDFDSAPEPDIAWVQRKKYSRHPTGADTLLLIEVADATLASDCGEKAALYAVAKIAEYWVVDIQNRRLLVHRLPAGGQYDEVQTLGEDESIAPLCAPTAELKVVEIFSLI